MRCETAKPSTSPPASRNGIGRANIAIFVRWTMSNQRERDELIIRLAKVLCGGTSYSEDVCRRVLRIVGDGLKLPQTAHSVVVKSQVVLQLAQAEARDPEHVASMLFGDGAAAAEYYKVKKK